MNNMMICAGIMDSIASAIGDAIDSKIAPIFQKSAIWWVDIGTSTFNSLVNSAVDALRMSPFKWQGGIAETFVSSVTSAFSLLGASLVVLFWIIGFCNESMDIKHEMRAETVMRSVLKLLIASFLVTNTMYLLRIVFSIPDAFGISGLGYVKDLSTNDIKDQILKLNTGEALGVMVLGMLYLVSQLMCGILIIYQAYTRFFKIIIVMPYGYIAGSTVAGNSVINHTAVAFYKYALSVSFEAVTMMLAIKLYVVVVNNNAFDLLDIGVAGSIIQLMLMSFILVGVVHSASTITQRTLGL